MDKIKTIRGMHDIHGLEFLHQKQIIELFESVANNFNFKPIATPIMEFNEIFVRTLGLSSDVVMKEMYTLLDRNNQKLTLRPEGTAGIARAIISSGLTQDIPLKFYYYGPMFRYERPQKGRLRQFTQVGVEVYANSNIEKDFEVISLAEKFLKDLNIRDNLTLKINNLGNWEDRKTYTKELKKYYSEFKNDLSEDSIIRLEKNPLRILDSKNLEDIEVNKNAPKINEYLSDNNKSIFIRLKAMLEDFNISFEEDPFLVRGLDYYSNTIFEFALKTDSKFAILAGGTYDNLISELGGPKLSGTGWAAGLERLTQLVDFMEKDSQQILIVPLEKKFINAAYEIRQIFLNTKFSSEVIINKNLKKSLKYGNKISADYAILIGEEEINNKIYTIKNLNTGNQNKVKKSLILEFFENA
ncbi:MAG: histidine--tRNA ligase [Pelagibacterales bacterium]|nr:histidine--tRNA ligase [Pelagibacterales bacterium]OUU61588.1 MAG: histidine--tRNA ligase [Alphaproteobacteria bacterium TMED62]|tara:strand:+ start:1203 stop:2441 length:1239 start_codon:yes stop_codon:yes gene_type:complete